LPGLPAAIVMRVLGAFGLTMVSLNSVVPSLKAFLMQYASLLPPKATAFLSAIAIDVFMTMILSALAIRLAWKVLILPKSVANSLPGAAS
jgi:hypothetical protein